jgi:hypothetical protein
MEARHQNQDVRENMKQDVFKTLNVLYFCTS